MKGHGDEYRVGESDTCLVVGSKGGRAGLLSVLQKLEYRKLNLNVNMYFDWCEGSEALQQVTQRAWSLHPWR